MEERISDLVEGLLTEESDIFLVGVLVKGTTGNQKVLVFLDSDTGLNIDDCASLSRKLGGLLEEEDLMQGKYNLEVSSPGLDYPIKLKRQYAKNIGRSLKIDMRSGEVIEGVLRKVLRDGINIVDKKNEEKSLDFSEIVQSKIEVSFK